MDAPEKSSIPCEMKLGTLLPLQKRCQSTCQTQVAWWMWISYIYIRLYAQLWHPWHHVNLPKGPRQSINEIRKSRQFMSSQIFTKWIPDSEFSWNLFVYGKNEQNDNKRISVAANKYHVSNICLRVSAQPISMEKIMIGISPVSYSDLH